MNRRIATGTALLSALTLGAATPAVSAPTFTEALTGGSPSLDARYRYEFVDQDDDDLDNAHASTLRVRLGYQTGNYQGFDALLESEHVTAIGSENYNSTINGNTERSVVADPTETEINQAWVRYTGLPDTDIRYGRQRLALDNHRFIGTVGWRQNEQTYDAFTVRNESIEDLTLTAGYLYNANRVFSDASPQGNFRLRAPIANASYSGLDAGTLSVYSYLLEFPDEEENSTQTWGARFSGDQAASDDLNLLYTLEYAYQRDYRNNPESFDVDYIRVEGGARTAGVTLRVGQERLGSYRGRGFQTPLATLHAMNGWTDQFLGTPENGLRDTYASVATAVAGVNLLAVYHDFRSDAGSSDFGQEMGLQATYSFGGHYTVGAKAAYYDADERGVDTTKAWLWGQVSF